MSSVAGDAWELGRGLAGELVSHARQGIDTTGRLVVLAVSTIKFLVTDIPKRRFSWEEFTLQCSFMTRVALFPTIMVAIPFGVIISVQIGAVTAQIGATSFTGAVNGSGVLQQGAPLVASLLISGAIGSAITSDLGARTVREEIDALKVMGISPVQRLVAPRLLAACLVSLLLTVIVAMSSLITTYVINVGSGRVSSGAYMDSFVQFAKVSDLILAEGKALVFGFLATIVCCHKGLTAKGGAKGVADAVNQAVVLSVILLAIANVAITQGYAMLFPARLG